MADLRTKVAQSIQISLKHLSGQHNQKRHGWRGGSLENVRRGLRAGISSDFEGKTSLQAERAAYRKRHALPEPKKIDLTLPKGNTLETRENIAAAVKRISEATAQMSNDFSPAGKAVFDKFNQAPDGTRVALRNGDLGTLRWTTFDNGTSNRRQVRAFQIEYDKPQYGRKISAPNSVVKTTIDALDPALSWLKRAPLPKASATARVLQNTDVRTVMRAIDAFRRAGGPTVYGITSEGKRLKINSFSTSFYRGKTVTSLITETTGGNNFLSPNQFARFEIGE